MARQVKVITAAEAAALIKNGDTVRKILGNRRTQRYYLCLLRFSG